MWQKRFENFEKAFLIFNEVCDDYIKNPEKNSYRLGLVQSYEIVFELSWKLLKDYLKENGINVNLPRAVIKEAFGFEIIKDGQIWINMLDDRNSTSHEYDEKKADIILNKISNEYKEQFVFVDKFFKDLK